MKSQIHSLFRSIGKFKKIINIIVRKKIILLSAYLCLSALVVQSQTTYDVFTYTEPVGYKKEIKKDVITYTKNDTKTGAYCIIGLYAQSPSSGNLQKDFDNDWAELVAKPLGITAVPQKDNGDEITGWKTYTGAANFEFGGATSIAVLTTAKKDNANIAVLIVTNTQSFLTTDVDAFFDKLKLSNPKTITTNSPNVTIKKDTLNSSSSSKIDVWMFLKYAARTSDYYPVGSIQKEFYAVFSNNDYYPYYPTEGMGNLNNTNKQNDSWGKFSVQGNKITIQSKYENETLNKKTSTIYEKPNATFLYYKCARVDGLTLLGGWTYDKAWRENRYNQGDCRPVIYFGTDGSFIDRGAFLYACGSPSTNPKDQPGQGTYSINNFTLTLKYKDGRSISKAFCGNFDKSPTVDNSLLHIGNTAFYKDIN
jgi:hypothetical protein